MGRVVLLGDAAAGFLPTAGIGAGMALESALALTKELTRTDAKDIPRHCADTKICNARESRRPRTIRDCWLGWSSDATGSLRHCVI